MTHRISGKVKNAIYRLEISALVPEIFKFEKCVKQMMETRGVMMSFTQPNITSSI